MIVAVTLSYYTLHKIYCTYVFVDHFRSAFFSKPHSGGTSVESNHTSDHMLFRDFLREQIDNLMTGDGRDGLAEGRRGTHVEVVYPFIELSLCVPMCLLVSVFVFFAMQMRTRKRLGSGYSFHFIRSL